MTNSDNLEPFLLPTLTTLAPLQVPALGSRPVAKEGPLGVSGAPPQQYFMYLVSLLSLLHSCSMFCHRPLILSQLQTLHLCKDCALQIWIPCSLFRDMKANSSYLTVLSGPSKILPWPCSPQFVHLFLTLRIHHALRERVIHTKCEISFLYSQ